MRRNYWIWSVLFVVFLVAGACGGGGGGGGGGGNLNSLLDGEYVLNQMVYSGTVVTPMTGILTASGAGTATAAFAATTIDLSYDVNTDMTVTVSPVGGGEPAYGILSADNNILALTDTEYDVIDPLDKDVVLALAVAKSATAATTVIGANQYIVSQAGTNASGFYTSRVLVTVNSSGIAGTFLILSHSQISGTLPSGPLTISASTPDGTFIVNNGTYDYPGVITPDGNIFSQIGTNISDQIFAMGAVEATAGTPDEAGEYLLNQIGFSSPWYTVYTSRVQLIVDSNSKTYDYRVLAHSLLTAPLDSGTGIAYSISADGRLTFPGNTGWGGIVSPDGSVLVLSDTDTATPAGAGDIFFAVGIKKP